MTIDDLDLRSLREAHHAAGGRWALALTMLDRTGSTNDDAKRAAAAGAQTGTTFVADEQSTGRGRQGRTWHAPSGSALLASVVVRPRLVPSALPPLALVVGAAVADAIAMRTPGHAVGVKWPNDVLIDGKKLAGVLVEASLAAGEVGWAVVGVGINVRRASLPVDVAGRATCMEDMGATSAGLGRAALLGDVLAGLERRLEVLEAHGLGALLDELRARDATTGRRAVGDQIEGVAEGIAEDGRLLVRTSDGRLVALAAGDVALAAGDVTLAAGNVALAAGNVALAAGNVALAAGNVALAAGNVALAAGNVALAAGDVALAASNVALAAGDVALAAGDVTLERAAGEGVLERAAGEGVLERARTRGSTSSLLHRPWLLS